VHETLSALAIGLLAFGLFSKRLENSSITGPLAFAAIGFVLATTGVLNLHHQHSLVHILAEVALVLVLFMDAARIDLGKLKKATTLPIRMLVAGIPLMIVMGSLIGLVLLPELGFWEIALIAAILAPTDAALGQSVVSSKAVPLKVRQALNVESGLNDGIALPVILIIACVASIEHGQQGSSYWIVFTSKQLVLGPLTGALIGIFGAKAMDWVVSRNLMSSSFEGIGAVSLAGLCYLIAEMIGGNGFIAAFVGGLSFGNSLRHQCKYLFEFGESEGQLLVLATFFVFGTALFPEVISILTWEIVLYAILSLVIARPVAIAISLVGTGTKSATVGFMGWFGPRGLASVLFVLLVLDESELINKNVITAVIFLTVAFSIVLHGISAAPASKRYGKYAERSGEFSEHTDMEEIPWRIKPSHSQRKLL